MEEKRTATRPSGIPAPSGLPRLSRLPVPRSASARTTKPYESLNSDLHSPLSRQASRELLPHSPSTSRTANAANASRSQLRSARARVHRSNDANRQSLPPAERDPKRASQAILSSEPQKDEFLFKRPLTLTRRPSEIFSVNAQSSENVPTSASSTSPQDNGPRSSSTDESFSFDTPRPRSKPRPSLAERTVETLSQLPSSPAISKKSSVFFDPESAVKSRSRAESGGSRPGSGYRSDVSNQLPSRPQSRPGSSSEPDESAISSFRASTKSVKPLSTIDGTPAKRPSLRNLRGGANSLRATSRNPSSLDSELSLALPKTSANTSVPRTAGASGQGPRTAGARPLKPRSSVNGLFKKPSIQTLGTAEVDAPREPVKTSNSAGAWDGVITPPSKAPGSGRAFQAAEPTTDAPPFSARKSSAALREQIAKAKAAKRAAMRQSNESGPVAGAEAEMPVMPDEVMGFGATEYSPFNSNQRRSEIAKGKILRQRFAAARTSGRLNLAAMGLKQMPLEVLKMYDSETIGTYDGSWAESVDLTRFVAADNELERIDEFIFPDRNSESYMEEEESQGNIFGGLEMLDLHGNLLVTVPLGLRQLHLLTSLNLSQNRLTNNSLDTISQITALRDLKLSNNLLYGPLGSCFSNLRDLEILDIHGNNVSALPDDVENLTRLRILNISENSFESLPFSRLAKLPLHEINARKNKIKGTLMDSVESLTNLQSLDVSNNQLTRLVTDGSMICLPSLHQLTMSMNRLQALPDMSSWTSLLTLMVDENCISAIPDGFTRLEKLRHADFTSNDIRVIPPEVGRMDNLAMIRLSGNPLRDKKFASITTDELKDILSARLEPPPPYQERNAQQAGVGKEIMEAAKVLAVTAEPLALDQTSPVAIPEPDDDNRSDLDNFATPPTSAPTSPLRSRSHTLTNHVTVWPVKPGGVLDRANTQSSSLHPVVCANVAVAHKVQEVQLHHNLFSTLPNSLSFFAETLTALSLAHNQLVAESFLTEELELPALRELNLVSNHITSLTPLMTHLRAPKLEKIDVSFNRITAIPLEVRTRFPKLVVLLASNNHLVDLDPMAIKGLEIVDVSNNDIAHLDPRLGLLGGNGGLRRLEVSGNRFRVPRWSVLERGTEATLRWLRGRVPVAEIGAWKEGNGSDSSGPETSMTGFD